MRGIELATASLVVLASATGCSMIRVNPYNVNAGNVPNVGGSVQDQKRDTALSAVSSCASARGFVVQRAGNNLLRAAVSGLGNLEFSTEAGSTLHLSVLPGAASDPGQAAAMALKQRGDDLFNCAHANVPELTYAAPVMPPPQPMPMAQPVMNEQPIVTSHYCNRLSTCLNEVRTQLCQPSDQHCSGQYQFHIGTSDVQCYNILVNLPFGLEQSKQKNPQMQVPASCDLKGEAYTKQDP